MPDRWRIQGIGAALGIAGYQTVELWLRRRALAKKERSEMK